MYLLLLFGFIVNVFGNKCSLKKHSQFYLQNKFEPILEEKTIEITNDKELFQKLDGSFFAQIGSNPKYINNQDYHWFDGDGMIHAILINKTFATYQNRWVQTKRLQTENKWKRKMYAYFGELRGINGIFQAIKYSLFEKIGITSKDKGTANTAMLYWNKKLYALQEGDKPYEMAINYTNFNLSTKGRLNKYDNIFSTSAHPIIDNNRDLLYLYGYNNYDFSEGKFIFNVFNKEMELLNQRNISLLNNGMIHEACFTGNKMIIPDLPLKYDTSKMIEGELPLYFDKNNGTTRFGLFDVTNQNSPIDWYYFKENFFIFHFIKSFEKGDFIIIYACVMETAYLSDFIELDVEKNPSKRIRGKIRLKELIIDTKKNITYINENAILQETTLGFHYNLDFPVKSKMNPNDIYLSIFNASSGYIVGYMKCNVKNFLYTIPDIYLFENSHYGNSEPQVVTIDNKEYLLTFTNDDNQSYLSLIHIANKTIENLIIKERIPPGFHSIYISD